MEPFGQTSTVGQITALIRSTVPFHFHLTRFPNLSGQDTHLVLVYELRR